MDGNEKTEIRTQLHTYLVKHHASVPAYIRNKVLMTQNNFLNTEYFQLADSTLYFQISEFSFQIAFSTR